MEAMVIMKCKALKSAFWAGRRVLLTGHTGFKGTWLMLMLQRLGADVTGVSLPANDPPSLFNTLSPWPNLRYFECDIRDPLALEGIVQEVQPEIVIHMAAQALVIDSYADPIGTISTNVMGTVHLLESLRRVESLLGVLVITSDKVYENRGTGIDFAEAAALGGHDAYSASKAATEILTSAYQRSFFAERNIPVVTARAGNVIGGGDWARNRLIPDLWRAYKSQQPVFMRNPGSVRPWQHVLDPLYGYLLYIQHVLSEHRETPASLNFGPPRLPTKTVLQLAEQFATTLGTEDLWTIGPSLGQVHESSFLAIDSTLAFDTIGWRPLLVLDEAIKWTYDWYRAYDRSIDMRVFSETQIDAYADLAEEPALARLAKSISA